MRLRVLLISVIATVVLLIAVAWGVTAARNALSSFDSAGGELDLICEAEIAGEREVAVNISWKWIEKNPHPGLADEIVILGPETWCSMDEPGAKPPVSTGKSGQTQFGVVGEAEDAVRSMVEAGNVKAFAAIKPNEDGSITVYLKTKADPVAFEDKGSARYLTVKRIPSPMKRPTLIERLLRLFGVGRTEIAAYEKQMPLSPWRPDIEGECPGYVGEQYAPSLTMDNPNPDLDKMAMALFTDYLEHHTASDQPIGQRLEEYNIEGIKAHKEDANHFWFSVGFSVKPATLATWWGAGNGRFAFNGWIEEKYLEMDVVKEGNTFKMVGGGTGGHLIGPK